MGADSPVSQMDVATYAHDGVVLLKGLLRDWVEELRIGVERNLRRRGPYAADNLKAGEGGRFFTTTATGPAFRSSRQPSGARPLRR
jgi:hypothetical protein